MNEYHDQLCVCFFFFAGSALLLLLFGSYLVAGYGMSIPRRGIPGYSGTRVRNTGPERGKKGCGVRV